MILLKGGDKIVVKLLLIDGVCKPFAVSVPVDSGSLLTSIPKRRKVSAKRKSCIVCRDRAGRSICFFTLILSI